MEQLASPITALHDYQTKIERLTEAVERHEQDVSLLTYQHHLAENKQKIITRICSHPTAREFYHKVQIGLNQLFLAAMVINSGLVDRSTSHDTAANVVQFIGSQIDVPILKGVFKALEKGVRKYMYEKKHHRMSAAIESGALNVSDLEMLAESIARKLTKRYWEQLQEITPDGAQTLAQDALAIMIEAMKDEDKLDQDLSLNLALVKAVRNVQPSTFLSRIFRQNTHIETKSSSLNWNTRDLFSKSGVTFIDQDGQLQYAVPAETDYTKYGFCFGCVEECPNLTIFDQRPETLITENQALAVLNDTLKKTALREEATLGHSSLGLSRQVASFAHDMQYQYQDLKHGQQQLASAMLAIYEELKNGSSTVSPSTLQTVLLGLSGMLVQQAEQLNPPAASTESAEQKDDPIKALTPTPIPE